MHNLTSSAAFFAAADAANGSGAPAPEASKPEAAAPAKPETKAKRAAKPGKPATKAAKPGKPAKRATVTEAPEADKRAAAAERKAADRATVAAVYGHFARNASVPVKPVRGFKLATTTAHPITRDPSQRQAAAICVAFSASGVKLSDGAKAPRCFDLDGVPSATENGVMRDAVSSGLIRVAGASPEAETLTLTKAGVAFIRANVGDKLLKAHKLI